MRWNSLPTRGRETRDGSGRSRTYEDGRGVKVEEGEACWWRRQRCNRRFFSHRSYARERGGEREHTGEEGWLKNLVEREEGEERRVAKEVLPPFHREHNGRGN